MENKSNTIETGFFVVDFNSAFDYIGNREKEKSRACQKEYNRRQYLSDKLGTKKGSTHCMKTHWSMKIR